MEKKKCRIKIKDLDVDVKMLKKISPKVLTKIRGGAGVLISMLCAGGRYCVSGGCTGTGFIPNHKYRLNDLYLREYWSLSGCFSV